MIRSFVPDDIPDVIRLHQTVFGVQTAMPAAALEDHLHTLIFESPFRHPEVPSYVWTEKGRGITGFLGAVPVPLAFHEETIRAAAAVQLMVDRTRPNPFAAIRLLSKLFSAGHDLVVADGASDRAAGLWESCGGDRLWLQGMRWVRTIRPGRELAGWMHERRPGTKAATAAVTPLLSALDAAFARLRPNHFTAQDELVAEPLTPELLSAGREGLAERRALFSCRDTEGMYWLFDRLKEKEGHGEFFAVHLREPDGAAAGWYAAYVRKGGNCQVASLGATPEERSAVMNQLFRDAYRRGAVAVRGAMDVALVPTLTDMHARFTTGAPWSLAYSPRPEIMAALHRGDTDLGRLDMEFWTRFLGG